VAVLEASTPRRGWKSGWRGRADLEVTLVTRENYFLFTPTLPEVASGELEISTIINPLRRLLKRVKSFVGVIEAIDLQARRVRVSHAIDGHTHELSYDQLILALGAGTNFFNLPGWAVADCAAVSNPRTGGFHPPTAQHALREGTPWRAMSLQPYMVGE
jgi:NADH dehydrogenase FAD-containing subunit